MKLRTDKIIIGFTLFFSIAAADLILGQEINLPERFSGCQQWLTLTDQQKEQIDILRADLGKAILPLQVRLKTRSSELDELLITENPDITAIDHKLDEISSIKSEIEKRRIHNRLKIRALLNEGQRIKFDQMRVNRRRWMNGGAGHFFHKGRQFHRFRGMEDRQFERRIDPNQDLSEDAKKDI